LGIPPMSQYDAAATPMWRSFTNQANFTPFTALPAQVNLNDKNTVQNELSKQSALFDFSKEDRAPDREFNEVLWKAVKGENAVMPAPKRAGFVKQVDRDKD